MAEKTTIQEIMSIMDGYPPPPVTEKDQYFGYWEVAVKRLKAQCSDEKVGAFFLLAGFAPREAYHWLENRRAA